MSADLHPVQYRFSKADHRPLDVVKINTVKAGLVLVVNGKRTAQLESRFAAVVVNELQGCLRGGEISDATLGRTQFRAFRDGEFIKLLFCVIGGDMQESEWIKLTEPQTESLLRRMQEVVPAAGTPETGS